MSRWPIALSFVGGLAVAGGGWALWPSEPPQRSSTELMNVLMWNREPVGGPFTLIDHDGRPRTDADFRGKLMLIYFGFTFCSNTCPTDLQAIAGSLDQLGAAGDAVQPLFITVDPEKDTPAQLKGYVRLFHPRMIGLTGSPKQIRKVANDYKVYYAKAEPLKRADVMSTTRVSRSWSAGTVSISASSHPALRPTASPRRFARTSRCRPRADSPPAQRRPLRLANLKTVERGMLVLVPFQPD